MGSIALPITVLLVDANKEDREYWVQRLTISSQAFSVLEADNGAAGLGICQSQRIDCVVVELTLPDMPGFQFLTRVIPRAFRPQIPVILFSRLNLPPMRRLAMNNGAQTYLVKSDVAGHELVREIHKAIAAVARRKGHYSTAEASAQRYSADNASFDETGPMIDALRKAIAEHESRLPNAGVDPRALLRPDTHRLFGKRPLTR